jgi:predicted nucleic acid-binding protein
LDRRFRTGDFSKNDYERLVGAFTQDWRHFVVLDFNEMESGSLVKKYGLRGFDAVHLSSAILMKGESDFALNFSSFDEKLNKAAKAEGLEVILPD